MPSSAPAHRASRRPASRTGALTRLCAVVAACLVALTPVSPAAASPTRGVGCPDDRQICALIVEVDDGAVGQVVAEARARGAADAQGVAPDAVSVKADRERARGLELALSRLPGVVGIRVDPLLETFALPNDPRVPDQRQYLDAVRLPRLWDSGRANGQLVAVVDTGVDETHPDLMGRVVDRFDATTGASTALDVDGHGTAVASVAAASTDNGVQIAGSGWGANLLAAKVDDPDGLIYLSAVTRALRWSADRGADVINVSLGGPDGDPLLQDAVAYAKAAGALVVASAGNSGTTDPVYPAAYPSVLSVGSTTRDGATRSSFSNYGPWVDVAAPGEALLGATLTGGLESYYGTSFSAPLVAGGTAVIRASHPDATPDQVADAVTATAGPNPPGFASGLADLQDAAAHLSPADRCLPPGVAVSVAQRADGVTARGWRDPATGAARVQVVAADGTRGAVEDLGGAIVGGPSLAWHGDGSLEVAGRGTNDVLYYKNRGAAGTYSAWRNFGARLTARPDLTPRPDGGVDALVRGLDGGLHLYASTGIGVYGTGHAVGGALLAGAGPGASYDSTGRLVVAVIGADRALWTKVRTGFTFGGWRSGGGVLVGDVDAATPGTTVQVAGLGTNSTIYTQGVGPDATGTGWARVAGLDVVAPPSAAAAGGGGFLLATSRSGDQAQAGWNGTAFTGWSVVC